MDMKRGTAAFAAAVTICVAGCATKPVYVPPTEGEPQATIRNQWEGFFVCTHAYLFDLDDQIFPYHPRAASRRISPGPHVATIRGEYGAAPIIGPLPLPLPLIWLCGANCGATLQFTAESSHAYQLVLVKEDDPYHIDLIDSETNQLVASAPCTWSFQKREKPQAPDSGTDEGAKDEFLKR